MSVFRTKPLAKLLAQAADSHGLKRTLGWPGLVALGIGAIIGAGLFVRTAAAAAQNAAEQTAHYASGRGRSRLHGDRSIGTPDPGAVSFALTVGSVVP